MSMNLFIAALEIGGSGFVNQMVTLLVFGLVVLIVYLMGRYFATRPQVPPIVMQIWNGIFVLLGGIVLINFLMGLGDKHFIKW